jgi:hypothetical protein
MDSPAIDLKCRVVRSAEPISVKVMDGLVMLSLAGGRYFSLNSTAAAIWERLEKPATLAALCEEIAAEYNTSAQAVTPSVLNFIGLLVENGIATSATPNDTAELKQRR